jgi:hypothetical protein
MNYAVIILVTLMILNLLIYFYQRYKRIKKEIINILLYQILDSYEHGIKQEKFKGLCHVLNELYLDDDISFKHYSLMRNYFKKYLPQYLTTWSWPPKDTESRINWLKEHIRKNS